MKYLFQYKLAKILLLLLFSSSFLFTQRYRPAEKYFCFINYKGEIIEVLPNEMLIKVKKDYFNDELFEKFKKPPYSLNYSIWVDYPGDYIDTFNNVDPITINIFEKFKKPPYSPNYSIRNVDPDNYVRVHIYGDSLKINISDHYYFFDKEEWVEEIQQFPLGYMFVPISPNYGFDLKGQIYHNGVPLNNHIIYIELPYSGGRWVYCSSISDENGNFVFPSMPKDYEHTIYFYIGDTRYDTTFMLNGNKIVNFNNGSITIDINELKELPTEYSLLQNFPNPFNPTTTIQYSIPNDEFVKLTVYDITGRVVKELVNGYKTAGKYNVEFNANSYSSGTYYYKLEAGEYKNIQKMMLIK